MSLTGQSYGKNASEVDLGLASSTDWQDLRSETRYVDSGYHLLIDAKWVAAAGVAAGEFRLTVNNSQEDASPAPVGTFSGGCHHDMPIVTTGSYTVKLQCRRDALGTLAVAIGAAKLRVMHVSS